MNQRKPTTKKARKWEKAFLTCYSKCGNVTQACRVARMDRTIVYDLKKQDPNFALRMDVARQEAADVLEQEARRRAVRGVREPVYQGGKRVGFVQKYSDTLLIFLMKGADPEKYRERHQINGQVDSSITLTLVQSNDFYGNANRIASETARSSIADSARPIAIQAIDVRPEVGQNGNGTNGKHRGPRSGPEDVQGGGDGRDDLVGGSEPSNDS